MRQFVREDIETACMNEINEMFSKMRPGQGPPGGSPPGPPGDHPHGRHRPPHHGPHQVSFFRFYILQQNSKYESTSSHFSTIPVLYVLRL